MAAVSTCIVPKVLIATWQHVHRNPVLLIKADILNHSRPVLLHSLRCAVEKGSSRVLLCESAVMPQF